MSRGNAPKLIVLAAGKARRYGGCKPLAPVGLAREPIIDLLASDALSAGFGTIIVVLSPSSGPQIRSHIQNTWPKGIDVRFAVQQSPRGTVDAVLSATDELSPGEPFGVANADDLYGEEALESLADHLSEGKDECALVGFRLGLATIGTSPVTRGVCSIDDDGYLTKIDERRNVVPSANGAFRSDDGRQPTELDEATIVSMNLWGLTAGMLGVLKSSMAEAMSSGQSEEVLLPEVISETLRAHRLERSSTDETGPKERIDGHMKVNRFFVLQTDSRCIGVTHPDDLSLVQSYVADQVRQGKRSATLWSFLDQGSEPTART